MPMMPSGPRPKSGKRLEVEAPTAPWTIPWTADDGVALRELDGEVPLRDDERWLKTRRNMVSAKKMTYRLSGLMKHCPAAWFWGGKHVEGKNFYSVKSCFYMVIHFSSIS